MRYVGFGRVLFAAGLIGLGVLGLVYADFALQWQPVPRWVPGRRVLADVSGVLSLAVGAGLLWRQTIAAASRILLVYVTLWLVVLKIPQLVMAPTVEVNWNGTGEIAVLVAAGLVLFATLPDAGGRPILDFARGARGLRIARLMFAVALPAIGLSHFVYHDQTTALVPTWLPARSALAYLTGAAHIAAGLGVGLAIYPRLAAMLEAVMISLFTLLVWVPGVVAHPTNRVQWTAVIISWTIGAASWVVADSYSSDRPARD
jgi:uncharacterized membrane protein